MNKIQREEQARLQRESKTTLKDWLKPGDTVYTVIRHCSKSGMMRHISAQIVLDGKLIDISWHVAHLLEEKRADNGGIKVSGCGMDMGFELVYRLGYALFKDDGGYQCPGKNCQHNSHFNDHTDRDGNIFHKGDMGYSLHQEWR